ncbi:MAG: HAD family hydrolase [Bdellovibrionaceae bacterium]|nr:HAD family hydrolase [Pseudobdellovibrionaceae bacterium]NUM58811.1 HAD family hydrolase [Pseudobdellovibrionaceae bacterium]
MTKVIAFDLDDTLLNTTDILIPLAIKEVYSVLQQRGYKESFLEFNNKRLEFVGSKSHREFFKSLVTSEPQLTVANKTLPSVQLATEETSLYELLVRCFYQPPIPMDLPLIPGAKENLDFLSTKYTLYLVTSGETETQKQKIKSLHLSQWIPPSHHLIIDGLDFKNKRQAFQHILQQSNIPPTALLAIGNRLSQEIRMAKEIGAMTCYFRFGEHASDIPTDQFEVPDYTITQQQELISVCRL